MGVSKAQAREFITLIGTIAQKECIKRGYGNAQLWTCIAQACDESAYGTAKRMSEAFAPFGIKATQKWVNEAKYGGLVYSSKTHEVYSGVNTIITATFRAYKNYEDAVADYFDLMNASRYKESLTAKSVKGCITIIKNGDYATATNYINTICNIYEKFKTDIEKFDVGSAVVVNGNSKEKTNDGLVEYAKAQLGLPYWYGTFGQTSTEALYNSKKKQYPKYYTANDYLKQLNKRVHDCVGIVKGYIWSDTPTSKPTYNASQDKSAKGMYGASEQSKKGTIASFPYKNGLLVYKGKPASSIHHVGVYCTDGYVYEAKGHAYGVVKTLFKASEWDFWSQCPYISETVKTTVTTPNKSVTDVAKEVIAGKWGNGTDRKKRLTEAGYNYTEIQKEVNRILKG